MKQNSPRCLHALKVAQGYFNNYKWRLFWIYFGAITIVFYIWMKWGTDLPLSETILRWAAPLLVAFIVKLLVDTHTKVEAAFSPDTVDYRECVDLLFQRLRRTAGRKQSLKPITIDLLGVALCHSHEWMEKDLPTFLGENPNVRINLRVAFVDPDILSAFNFDTEPFDWAAESRERITWVREKLTPLTLRYNQRLRIHVRTIQNLPHWHGILVERRYLYLGRVSWLDGDERHHMRPTKLTCAQNRYRVFDCDDRHHGDDRVSLFRRWMAQYLYGNHGGRTLVDTIPHDEQMHLPISA